MFAAHVNLSSLQRKTTIIHIGEQKFPGT